MKRGCPRRSVKVLLEQMVLTLIGTQQLKRAAARLDHAKRKPERERLLMFLAC